MSDTASGAGSQPQKNESQSETQQYFAAGDVVRVLDDYLEKLKAGCAPTREELLTQYPELASQLDACLAGLNFLHAAQSATTESMQGLQQQIGDFRIVREVGRGGMGAVFEAVQISLGRRVALKILRFSSVSDKDAIERFQREAETVATLHHTNIVPIFFVGSEKSVNYYAMQFIEGRDLAQVIGDSRAQISATQVAAWGLQAAEALAHAHRRGVIHRDVKPSNLILDNEDRLWLTDFGLARRADDVTLSLSGMLLGTPRYMSPEHAQASSKRIDHRSDLFSLGTTLYELLTRQPAFPGDVAHDVIQHILIDEPTPIRQLNPSVPRDLETIVMKCMAKDPSQRYESADKLASDLRAVLDDRPIQARRASAIEQAARWLKQNRRSVSQVSTAAMVTLAVTLTSLLGWSSYQSWNMSSLQLNALQPQLVAEVLDDSGKPIRTETLPMQNATNLPAGDYKVRVSAEGSLSQDFNVSLDRGARNANYTGNVADQWLMTPQPLMHSFDVVDLGGERAVAVWGKEDITVYKHRGPQMSWTLRLSPETAKPIFDSPGYMNPVNFSGMYESAFGEANETRPWMIHEFMDVNADGIGDLVCAGRHQAWIMAISGKGEGVIWFAGRGKELATHRDYQTASTIPHSSVLYPPMLCGDLDKDGVSDFLVTVADPGTERIYQNNGSLDCDIWIEAISARTGESIWKLDLNKSAFALPGNQQIPIDLRWFGNMGGGYSSQGGGISSLFSHRVRSPTLVMRNGMHYYMPTRPKLITLPGMTEETAAMVAGDKLLWIDPKLGTLREPPIELGIRPARDIDWADIDGDRAPDLVALEETTPGGAAPNGLSTSYKLAVWSSASRQLLWSKPLSTQLPRRSMWGVLSPKRPLVCDLNSDGVSEIVVPEESPSNNGLSSVSFPKGTIALVGSTDVAKWKCNIVNIDSAINYFIDGPDVDGDGTREIFAATGDSRTNLLRVDAISGVTGSILWSGSQEINCNTTFESFQIVGLQWWQGGKDGWPQLLVTVSSGRPSANSYSNFDVVSFSSGTGLVSAVGRGLVEVFPCDIDNDHAEDLIACSGKVTQPGALGSFHCIRGMIHQPWKRMSSLGKLAVDLNGDGFRDFIDTWGDGTLVANSGATGNEIWRSRDIRSVRPLGFANSDGTCSGDLNGDGVEDLLVHETSMSGTRTSPLHLVSGRNGKRIWSLHDVRVRVVQRTLAAQFVKLESDDAPDVVWVAAMDYGYPAQSMSWSSNDVQLWLCVASGSSGALKWAQPLSPAYGVAAGSTRSINGFHDSSLHLNAADLNSDDVKDFVVPAIREDGGLETRALSGKDGKILWRRSRQEFGQDWRAFENYTSPRFCDFEGDGRPETILVEPLDMSANPPEIFVTALDSNGHELWTKPTGCFYKSFRALSARGGETLSPVLIHASNSAAKKTNRVVVQVPSDRIVAFDSSGNHTDRPVDYTISGSLGIFPRDINSDGEEELLFMENDTLHAVRADKLDETIWKKKLGYFHQNSICEVIPRSESCPPIVVVKTDVSQNKVFGINAENGEEVWSCFGPIGRSADLTSYTHMKDIAVLGSRRNEPPLICFQSDFLGDCRQATLTQPKNATKDSASQFASFDTFGTYRTPANTHGLKDDPRWKRPLPFRMAVISDENSYSYFAWGIYFSLAMLICPIGYIGLVATRRGYRVLSYWLLAPVVAGILLQAVLIAGPYQNDIASFTGRFNIATLFAPVIVCLLLFAWWAIKYKWRKFFGWLITMAALTIAISAVALLISIRLTTLEAEESFDWQGWYMIAVPVIYCLCWLMMGVNFLQMLGRKLLPRMRREKFRPQATLGGFSLNSVEVATIAHLVHDREDV